MKKDIHPAYGKMKVTLSTGETIEMGSVLGAKKDFSMLLDVDQYNHPAFTKSTDQVVIGSSQRNKFEGKFASFMGTPAKKSAKKEA
jgi:ribosomal protein L31